MGLRPAKCYRELEKAYTRTSRSKPRKSYIKGVPGGKIHRFETGDSKKDFSLKAWLIARQAVQIRHNALEAARVAANKHLNDRLGKDGYFLKILVFPHHVLRENPIATGAGADRFQTGMKKAFGRPLSTAARVKPGQRLIYTCADRSKQRIVKDALKKAGAKFPTTCDIIFEEKK